MVQWSPAHVHLAGSHGHDEAHHQHLAQGHGHDLAGHHVNAIDISHADGSERFVELDHDCTSPTGKKLNDTASELASPEHYDWLTPLHQEGELSLTESSSFSSWLFYSTVKLRAPPLFIS